MLVHGLEDRCEAVRAIGGEVRLETDPVGEEESVKIVRVMLGEVIEELAKFEGEQASGVVRERRVERQAQVGGGRCEQALDQRVEL